MIARADEGRSRIWSRHGRFWTKAFPSVAAGLIELGNVVIDGEAVCQLEDGQSDFHALKGQDGCKRATLWAFDLLMIEGEDLRPQPIEVRRERLQRLLSDVKPSGIEYSEHSEGDGERLFEAACRMGLEGIVAKRKGSRYVSGRSHH